jgi:hypothetical protein
MEEADGDQFTLSEGPVLPVALPFNLGLTVLSEFAIPSKIVSRKFTFGTTNSKRFSTAAVEVELETTSKFDTIVNVQNPDSSEIYDTFEGYGPEDYLRRMSVGKRGLSADLTLQTVSGRPIFKSISIDATNVGRYEKSEH